MSGYLLDTDVLSEPQKPRPHEAVLTWLRQHEADLYTSAIVIGGASSALANGKKRRDLVGWLHDKVIPRMEGRTLRFDTRVALEWACSKPSSRARG